MRSDDSLRIMALSRSLLAAGAALALAPMARAQTPPAAPARDAIADILAPSLAPRGEPAPVAGGTAGSERALVPQTQPLAPAAQQRVPVDINETGKTPDGPPAVRDLAYDSRIRASFASAERFQGPLDGGWTLSAGGHDIYALQLVDRRDRLEGVWRDLRRKGSLNASGVVSDLQRQGPELILRFTPSPGAPLTVATLHEGSGQWSGELTEGTARQAVTLRRTSP